MALIESLIDKVEDPKLKARLLAEVKALKERKDFGLVFERHLPESVLLPHTVGVETGTEVRLRKEWNKPDNFIVTSVKGNSLMLESIKEDDKGNKEELKAKKEDVMVVRRFSQPIYPYLKDIGSVKNGGDKDPHLVIRSENYHALKLLEHTHAGKLDVIYIDPPYNTGDANWQYNNNYVDGNDAYRHSRWLSFMERRLLASKKLLKNDGILIVTIDEHEVHNLGVLLGQIFPGAKIQLVTIVINLGGQRKQEFSRVEEYAFFVFCGESIPNLLEDDLLTDSSTSKNVPWERLLRRGTGALRKDSPNLFYPIFINPKTCKIVKVGEPLSSKEKRDDSLSSDKSIAVWPIRSDGSEGRWRCSADYLRKLIKLGYVRAHYDKKKNKYTLSYLGKKQIQKIQDGEIIAKGKDKNGDLYFENNTTGGSLLSVKTVWNRRSHRAGTYGTSMIRELLPGKRFPFPKSLYAVSDCLRIACGDKKDALVLDFFAGSGTTLHATALLNAHDGGQRRAILVTNNEMDKKTSDLLMKKDKYPGDSEYEAQGVFELITMPRVKAAIIGKTPKGMSISGHYLWPEGKSFADGFRENCQFLQLDYLNPGKIELGLADKELFSIEWMLAGAHGMLPAKHALNKSGFTVFEQQEFAVLADPAALKECLDYFQKEEAVRYLFISTEYTDTFVTLSEALSRKIAIYQLPKDYLKFFSRRESV